MSRSSILGVRGLAAIVAAALGAICVSCASPRRAARVPVVRVDVRSNELTARQCDYRGAELFQETDALADAKDAAAARGANLVLAFGDTLSASPDEDTARPVCMTHYAQVVYVSCEGGVRSRVLAESVVIDDR